MIDQIVLWTIVGAAGLIALLTGSMLALGIGLATSVWAIAQER